MMVCTSIIGTNTSGDSPISVPVNPAGVTPTTVNGRELRRIEAPIAVCWPPNCRSQKPWLSTATAPRPPPLPGIASSSSEISEPSAGFTPSTLK